MNALCQMTGLSRASYYRWGVPPRACPVEMELRDALQFIAVECPAYGYRVIKGQVSGVSALAALTIGRRRLVRRSSLERWKTHNERRGGDGTMASAHSVDAVDA